MLHRTIKQERQELSKEWMKVKDSRLFNTLFQKSALTRSKNELELLALWLMFRVNYFVDTSMSLLRAIAERLEHKVFRKDEYMMVEGEIGDRMYIIIQGEVGIWKDSPDGTKHKQIATLSANMVVGETAIKDSRPRGASAIAHTDCEVLELTKKIFDQTIQQELVMGKLKRLQFLQTIKAL